MGNAQHDALQWEYGAVRVMKSVRHCDATTNTMIVMSDEKQKMSSKVGIFFKQPNPD